jgi:hypothetical protein
VCKTLFYKDERGKARETIVAPLTRGTVLLHRLVTPGLVSWPQTNADRSATEMNAYFTRVHWSAMALSTSSAQISCSCEIGEA